MTCLTEKARHITKKFDADNYWSVKGKQALKDNIRLSLTITERPVDLKEHTGIKLFPNCKPNPTNCIQRI